MTDRELLKVGAAIASVLVVVMVLRMFETRVQPPAVAPPAGEDPVTMRKPPRPGEAAASPPTRAVLPATAALPATAGARPDAAPAIARGAAEPMDPGPDPEPSVWPPTQDGIAGAVAESMPALAECYQGWLAVDPDLEGRVVLQFMIAESVEEPGLAGAGQVTVVEATTGARAFEACVTSVFSDLRFDVPDKPIEVHYPVVFTPG